MEQSSFRSSMQLQSLHVDSLIWTNNSIPSQHNIKTHDSAILNSNRSNNIILAKNTFQKTTKDQILSFIKPEYGSLGEFITDVNLSTDLLKQKKKKNDGQDQAQQKRIRLQLQNRNLNKILSNNQSTFQQRSVACKLLIERSFEQAFGTSINDFYNEQIQSLEPEQKKSILNLSSLSDALDEIINQTQNQVEQKPNKSFLFLKENMRKNRSYMKDNFEIMSEKENNIKKLITQKNNYRTLQRLHIPEQPTAEFLQMEQKYKKPHKSLIHNRHDSCSSTTSSQQKSIFKTFDGKSFVMSEKCVSIMNMYEITNETFLYLISKINFAILEEFSIVNTSFMNPDLLLLLIDLMALDSKNLKAFVIEDIQQILNHKIKEKLSQKMKNLIQTASDSLKLLRLNKLDLETKNFCIICLGIGSSKHLQTVEMKDNKIDETGKKSYDVITKFFKSLEINLEGNPLHKDIVKDKSKSLKTISK